MNTYSPNMMTAAVGDIVRFKPKFYGHDIEDQWVDLTGIILEVIEVSGCAPGVTALVQHPDDLAPIPIFAFYDDFELVENE